MKPSWVSASSPRGHDRHADEGESAVSDIDLQAKTWKIPSRRIKGNVPHKIGLEWLNAYEIKRSMAVPALRSIQ
jgi:hypothetical protein